MRRSCRTPSSFRARRPRSGRSRTRRYRWSTPRCRGCCRCPTPSAFVRRCGRGLPSTRRSTAGAGSTARIISTRTCRRAIRFSQLYHPLVGEGSLTVTTEAGDKTIGIERIHVEQDAGKLMHDQHPTMSYVDLNRSGVALMEIVSNPTCARPKRPVPMSASCASCCVMSAAATAYGTGLDARGRQRVGAKAGGRIRHADRDEERQFGALHSAGCRA